MFPKNSDLESLSACLSVVPLRSLATGAAAVLSVLGVSLLASLKLFPLMNLNVSLSACPRHMG